MKEVAGLAVHDGVILMNDEGLGPELSTFARCRGKEEE
jgi:hypothetical protein